MKLGRLGPIGQEIPVVVANGATFDISSLTDDIDGGFLASGDLDKVDRLLAAGTFPPISDPTLRIGSPIARPGAVICIGMNYAAHAAEAGAQPPDTPVVFFKAPNTVVGPNDPVPIPPRSVKTDWEVELGVVVGMRALYLDSPEDSMSHVAGFVVANDVSERAYQLEQSGGQWSKGKCAPGFNPLGPYLVTPDEVPHDSLRLRSWVNGEPRQDSTTADLIFDVDYVVWHLSQYMQLDPGDLILTGTPEGVALSGRFPYLQAGDVVEVEISGLGHQRQQFISYEEWRAS